VCPYYINTGLPPVSPYLAWCQATLYVYSSCLLSTESICTGCRMPEPKQMKPQQGNSLKHRETFTFIVTNTHAVVKPCLSPLLVCKQTKRSKKCFRMRWCGCGCGNVCGVCSLVMAEACFLGVTTSRFCHVTVLYLSFHFSFLLPWKRMSFFHTPIQCVCLVAHTGSLNYLYISRHLAKWVIICAHHRCLPSLPLPGCLFLTKALVSENSGVSHTHPPPPPVQGMFDVVETRFSFILPILEPENVANKLFQAIKRRREVLYMPRNVRFTCMGRCVPPIPANADMGVLDVPLDQAAEQLEQLPRTLLTDASVLGRGVSPRVNDKLVQHHEHLLQRKLDSLEYASISRRFLTLADETLHSKTILRVVCFL